MASTRSPCVTSQPSAAACASGGEDLRDHIVARSRSRSLTSTVAPLAANASAMPRPMSPPAPVTRATLDPFAAFI